MNKKAFTLVELLISIIILGVISVIAIPKTSEMIKSSKINSFEASAKSIARKIKNDFAAGSITGTQVDCMGTKYGTYNGNYTSCKADIFINDKDVVVSVDVVGKDTYAGYTILGAREDTAHAFENANTVSLKSTLLSNVIGNVTYGSPGANSGLYKWGNKYIYRGGITINNAALDTDQYTNDTYTYTTNVNNYIKVPWENNSSACPETYGGTSPCWRIVSINEDGSITIVRDKILTQIVYDNTVNTAARDLNGNSTNTYGYNDLLANVPTVGHPEEYRKFSAMYTYLYASSGYELNTIVKYINILKPHDVCLNKINSYAGINMSTYTGTTRVTDSCNVKNNVNAKEVKVLGNKYVRLPYMEEYLNASLEGTCIQDNQYQCRNKNFMYNRSYYWSLNGHPTSTAIVRAVNVLGHVSGHNAYNNYGVRPVVTLKSSVLILPGGTGAVGNPYVIKW